MNERERVKSEEGNADIEIDKDLVVAFSQLFQLRPIVQYVYLLEFNGRKILLRRCQMLRRFVQADDLATL